MQKLPEAPDKKYRRHMHKEKEPSRQKKETRSLSAVTVGLKTPYLSFGGRTCDRFKWYAG